MLVRTELSIAPYGATTNGGSWRGIGLWRAREGMDARNRCVPLRLAHPHPVHTRVAVGVVDERRSVETVELWRQWQPLGGGRGSGLHFVDANARGPEFETPAVRTRNDIADPQAGQAVQRIGVGHVLLPVREPVDVRIGLRAVVARRRPWEQRSASKVSTTSRAASSSPAGGCRRVEGLKSGAHGIDRPDGQSYVVLKRQTGRDRDLHERREVRAA